MSVLSLSTIFEFTIASLPLRPFPLCLRSMRGSGPLPCVLAPAHTLARPFASLSSAVCSCSVPSLPSSRPYIVCFPVSQRQGSRAREQGQGAGPPGSRERSRAGSRAGPLSLQTCLLCSAAFESHSNVLVVPLKLRKIFEIFLARIIKQAESSNSFFVTTNINGAH